MQSAKKAAESVKETAANIGASAKSGMEKSKAAVQEKTEKMTAHHPVEKEMATQKKDARISQAELEKQEAREHNVAARQSATSASAGRHHMDQGNYTTGTGGREGSYTTGNTGSATYSTTGDYGQPTGTHQMSAMPGHGTGYPTGNVTEGVVGSHPIGTETGTGRPSAAHNTRVGGNAPGYTTGGSYI